MLALAVRASSAARTRRRDDGQGVLRAIHGEQSMAVGAVDDAKVAAVTDDSGKVAEAARKETL